MYVPEVYVLRDELRAISVWLIYISNLISIKLKVKMSSRYVIRYMSNTWQTQNIHLRKHQDEFYDEKYTITFRSKLQITCRKYFVIVKNSIISNRNRRKKYFLSFIDKKVWYLYNSIGSFRVSNCFLIFEQISVITKEKSPHFHFYSVLKILSIYRFHKFMTQIK